MSPSEAVVSPPKLTRVIGVFGLTMMNVATLTSLRNLPFSAEYGAAAAFWLLIGAVTFFIPIALVSAELAGAFPHTGGIYLWIRAGLGPRMGLVAVWLQWLQNVTWYPTILTFLAGALAYLVNPLLLQNPVYVASSVMIIFWSITAISLRGVEATARVSTIGVIFGTFLPIGAIIVLGTSWLLYGHSPANPMSVSDWIPDLTNWRQLPLMAGLMLGLCGIEMPTVHAREVIDPQRTFPRATALSVLLILFCTVLGTLAIVTVVPRGPMNLVSGVLEAFQGFLSAFGLEILFPITLLMMAAGAVTGVANWVLGPCRALFASGKEGDLPPLFQKVNVHGVPWVILLAQGVIVSLITMVFVLLPDVTSSYWLLSAVCSQLYMLVYMMMFVAAIRIRRFVPSADFKIPGGWPGLGVVCALGFLSSLFGFLVPFIPLEGLPLEDGFSFQGLMGLSLFAFLLIPFAIHWLRKPSWMPKDPAIFD
jgi:glutamate:GABA antiporter